MFMPKIKCHGWAVAVMLLVVPLLLAGCYQDKASSAGDYAVSEAEMADTVDYVDGLPYSLNYNFVVKADSLYLLRQQPEEQVNGMITDSVVVFRNDRLVVADIRVVPADVADTVWVKVARDQETIGWTHQSELLPSVVPDDPISQFILTFSDTHLLMFLIVISIISVAYLMRTIFRRNAKIVHFNDIASFYPTLLAIIVASSASLYSSIQMFTPHLWQEFYYNPTLNPFALSGILTIFLIAVWSIFIVGLAAADVVVRELPFGEAVLYMCGLAGVCAINYIVFSITTLYYIGYPLLIAYIAFALRIYFSRSYYTCFCGSCGAPMRTKGRCPECGAINE